MKRVIVSILCVAASAVMISLTAYAAGIPSLSVPSIKTQSPKSADPELKGGLERPETTEAKRAGIRARYKEIYKYEPSQQGVMYIELAKTPEDEKRRMQIFHEQKVESDKREKNAVKVK